MCTMYKCTVHKSLAPKYYYAVYRVLCTEHCAPCTNTPCTSDLATKCYYDVHLVPRLKRGGEQSLHNNRHCPRHMRFLAIVATQETLSARSLQRVLARISKFAQIEKIWGGSSDYWTLLHNNRHCPPRAIVVILSATRNCCDSVSRNC